MEIVVKFRTGEDTVRKLDELTASNVGGSEVFLYQPSPLSRSVLIRHLINMAYERMVDEQKAKREKEDLDKKTVSNEIPDVTTKAKRKKNVATKGKVKK